MVANYALGVCNGDIQFRCIAYFGNAEQEIEVALAEIDQRMDGCQLASVGFNDCGDCSIAPRVKLSARGVLSAVLQRMRLRTHATEFGDCETEHVFDDRCHGLGENRDQELSTVCWHGGRNACVLNLRGWLLCFRADDRRTILQRSFYVGPRSCEHCIHVV
jgi:hypothetical protein